MNRKATYLSHSTWERLEFVVCRLGDYGTNVSSFLECIALRHLEEYSEDIECWRKVYFSSLPSSPRICKYPRGHFSSISRPNSIRTKKI
ncbi:DUF3408 domain-containing protein [Porphyromonas endodontalis]|uniref:DUF3408 domain-containing protein n=1 Tax=Porphyromonas endodontalis TaxID=28124 RepID=UPI00390486B4